jgi:hypothetical protein
VREHQNTCHVSIDQTEGFMTVIRNSLKAALIFFLMLVTPKVWAQGPPYQTDDPTPVGYKHYEAYIFGSVSGTPVAYGTLGPAFEFN